MQDASRAGEGRIAIDARSLARLLASGIEAFVFPGVECERERGFQTRAMGALLALGLFAAILSPVAAIAGLGLGAILVPMLASSALLVAAAALALTGKPDVVLAALFAVASLALAAVGVWSGQHAPLVLVPVAVAVAEAWLARRSALAKRMSATVVLPLAVLGFAGGGGGIGGEGPDAGTGALAAVLAAAYAVRLGRRGWRAWSAGRRRAEIRDAERRILGETVADAVLRLSPDGALVEASGAAAALFGTQGAAGGDLAGRFHLQDRVEYLCGLDELRNGAESVERDLRVADGSGYRALSLRLNAVRATDRTLAGVLAVARDRTGEQALAESMASALSQAEEASTAKSQFLAAISHELRTPLNAIIGFSDVLDQEFFGGFESPRQKEYVGLIRQSGEHLLQLVNGLLDISKIEAGRYELFPEPFRLAEVAKVAVDMVRADADRKGLELVVEGLAGGDEMVADRRACQQILLNLLSNAVKFTDAGRVTVTSRRRAGSRLIVVTDTGIGIAAGELPKLGHPFMQASNGLSRRYGGTGLGLSLVKGLVELHQGSMRIDSRPGVGTVVTVEIPGDCADRIRSQRILKENVVALNDARKKTDSSPQARPERRTA